MGSVLGLDFGGPTYRRMFRAVRKTGTTSWTNVEGKQFVGLNVNELAVPATDAPGVQQVFVFGVESEEEIHALNHARLPDGGKNMVFVVRLRPDNLYRFGAGILDAAPVLFVLDFAPENVEDRLQVFNLFHKALMMRRHAWALYYYHRVAEFVTSADTRSPVPPSIEDCLGADSILHQVRVQRDRIWRRLDVWHRRSQWRARRQAAKGKCMPKPLPNCRQVLVTGWYGTETAGDKAILLELVHALHENDPATRISITSIVPGLSRLTNMEVGIDAEVLELRDLRYSQLQDVDLLIFGGGPLCDSSQLKYIVTLFEWARRRGVATMLFGCGVGPLNTELATQRVSAILSATNHAFFRDQASAEKAVRLGYRGPALHACDPALRYVHRWSRKNPASGSPSTPDRLVALLRAQTTLFAADAAGTTESITAAVGSFIDHLLKRRADTEIELLPMHTYWLGNDDREHAAAVVARLPADSRCTASRRTLTLDDLLTRISAARWGMPMRFHGHVFMLALKIPFVSIDYTGAGGKVRSLMDRFGFSKYSLQTNDGPTFAAIAERWTMMEENYEDVRLQMARQLTADLEALESVYLQFWPDRSVEG